MANNKGRFGEVWDGLPSWAKGISVVGAGVILTVIGITTYKAISNALVTKKGMQAANDAEQDSAKLSAAGINPSYLGSEYETMAGAIKSAINDCNASNSEKTDNVLSVFDKMKNIQDVLHLIQAFGVRQATPCWQDITYLMDNIALSFAPTTYKGDLTWWLRQQLNTEDLNKLNKSLLDKGINFTF